MHTSRLKKILIPIAGLGTRMLPATKAIPKEMLPVVGKPIIQYIVEEAIEAGFEEIVFITHSSKTSIENHFDTSFELEAKLEMRVKNSLLKEIKEISKLNPYITSVRQGEAKGLGHAILCAKQIVGNEPFAISLPDMLIQGNNKKNNLSQMKKDYDKNNTSSILLHNTQPKNFHKYGMAKIKKNILTSNLKLIDKIIEKPSLKKSPSNFFAVGRYIFKNDMFSFLEKVNEDKSGEIQLSSAINLFTKSQNPLFGFNLEGKIFDCGEKLDYLKANIEFAKKDPLISKEFKKYLKNNDS